MAPAGGGAGRAAPFGGYGVRPEIDGADRSEGAAGSGCCGTERVSPAGGGDRVDVGDGWLAGTGVWRRGAQLVCAFGGAAAERQLQTARVEDDLQAVGHLRRRRWPLVGILGQRSGDVHAQRSRSRSRRERRRRVVDEPAHEGIERFVVGVLERCAPGDQVEEGRRCGVDVGALVALVVERLGRGVEPARGDAGGGCTGRVPAVGDTEVGQPRNPVGEEDVLRLDVAMQHAGLVGVVERPQGGDHQLQGSLPPEGALGLQQIGEGALLVQLHDHVGLVVGGVAGVIEGDHVLVRRQSTHHPALALEPVAVGFLRQLAQHLDRHPAVELGVGGRIHRAETAATDHHGVGQLIDAEIDLACHADALLPFRPAQILAGGGRSVTAAPRSQPHRTGRPSLAS